VSRCSVVDFFFRALLRLLNSMQPLDVTRVPALCHHDVRSSTTRC
jgi:hypothetical protein